MNESSKSEYCLREGVENDIPQLAIHHRRMFEEIWEIKSQPINNSTGDELESAYAQKLAQEMPAGTCKYWCVPDQDKIISSGAITIVSFVPVPDDMSSRVAYLHSIYTEKGHRGNGLAEMIVREAVAWCKANGIKRVILNASSAGRPVYEKIGFVSSPDTMRYFIE